MNYDSTNPDHELAQRRELASKELTQTLTDQIKAATSADYIDNLVDITKQNTDMITFADWQRIEKAVSEKKAELNANKSTR